VLSSSGLVAVFAFALILAGAQGWCEENRGAEAQQESPWAEGPGALDQEDEKNGGDEKLTPEQELRKAAEELEAGHIGEAYSIFSRLAEQEDEDIAARAREQLKRIEADGERKVKEILAIDNLRPAEEKLNEIYRDYRHTSVKHLLQEAQRRLQVRRARRALADAGAEEPDQEVAEEDKAARMWLIIGDIHRLNGREKQAIEAYYVVVYEHPESRFTEQARDWLKRLGADEEPEAAQDQGGKE